jgi:hypothetical protein
LSGSRGARRGCGTVTVHRSCRDDGRVGDQRQRQRQRHGQRPRPRGRGHGKSLRTAAGGTLALLLACPAASQEASIKLGNLRENHDEAYGDQGQIGFFYFKDGRGNGLAQSRDPLEPIEALNARILEWIASDDRSRVSCPHGLGTYCSVLSEADNVGPATGSLRGGGAHHGGGSLVARSLAHPGSCSIRDDFLLQRRFIHRRCRRRA